MLRLEECTQLSRNEAILIKLYALKVNARQFPPFHFPITLPTTEKNVWEFELIGDALKRGSDSLYLSPNPAQRTGTTFC